MYLHRSSNNCSATGSIQILAAAECYSTEEGACGRLGDERDWLDHNPGTTMFQLWESATYGMSRSFSPCLCLLSPSIQGKIRNIKLDQMHSSWESSAYEVFRVGLPKAVENDVLLHQPIGDISYQLHRRRSPDSARQARLLRLTCHFEDG